MRLTLIAGIAAATVAVQTPQIPQVPQTGFRAAVDLVPVYATVMTQAGTFVRGLTKEDFTLQDDGKPQAITSFSDEAQAISVSVILDTSSSMQSALPHVFGAARVFLDQLRADDRAVLGSLVYQGPTFSADKARLRTALDLLPPDPGSPVFAALDRALAALAPETNRPVIVIYTDGKNAELPVRGGSRKPANPPTAESVQIRAERAGVMVYAVGFEGVKLTSVMKLLATRTGGRATELKKSDDLGATLAAIADELHQQYLLGFTPASFDGATHALTVHVKSPDHIVRARQTYVATKAP
jgi:Ca-activated chloride channel family protein